MWDDRRVASFIRVLFVIRSACTAFQRAIVPDRADRPILAAGEST